MATSKIGGFGFEAYGDPFGLGGPLHVVRARALAGQVVRVTFDEEPLHRSQAAEDDGLNPANYLLTIVSGSGTAPVAVGVDDALVTGPAIAVQGSSDERALDVHVDRPMSFELIYRVTARNIKSKIGGPLGFPYAADFRGTVVQRIVQPPNPFRGRVDFASDPITGGYFVDDSGDVASESDVAGYKKRVFRRLLTPKGAFTVLPDYGLGLELKKPMSQPRLSAYKLDMVQQIKQEPETASVTPNLSLIGGKVLLAQIKIKTKKGAFVELGFRASEDGVVIT